MVDEITGPGSSSRGKRSKGKSKKKSSIVYNPNIEKSEGKRWEKIKPRCDIDDSKT